MNKSIRFIIAIIVLTNLITNSANAGFFSWKSSAKKAEAESVYVSFDKFFTNLQSFSKTETLATIHDAFIPESNNPSLSTSKKSSYSGKRYVVSASAYSSTPDQTDDSPFITASGTHVRRGVVAANFLPIGAAIRIPSIYGDEIFIVEDRMNSRYKEGYLDIWMETREEAKQFGRRNIEIEVI